jgi:D-Tyr-tRNAtyr deacylase
MRVVLQRVKHGHLTVMEKIVGKIESVPSTAC